jgi:uncharacterized protein YcaQ
MIQPKVARPLIADLANSGELIPVVVEGWTEGAYIPAQAQPGRPTRDTATLLSPFDSLIWDRERTRRLFGFDYRIEVYVPESKRQHGYYVLPLLLGDQLVARLDLKADRKASLLRVVGAFGENRSDIGAIAAAATTELETMRSWLSLDGIVVDPRGDLAAALRAELVG